MNGNSIAVKCPNCEQNIIKNLGVTEYVKIDDSERDYTKCKCYLCGKDYWLSHTVNAAIDVKKVTGNEKVKPSTIICW